MFSSGPNVFVTGITLSILLGQFLLRPIQAQPNPPELVLARFPVANDGDALLLPVELGGTRHAFWLNSGATHCAYDSSLRSLLGDPIGRETVTTIDETASVDLFNPPDAKLGKSSLRSRSKAFTLDLLDIREVSGHDIRGVVGMEFLGKCVFRLDPDRGEIVFLRTAGTDSGERVPVRFADSLPCVEASIAGIESPQLLQVVTGFTGEGSICQDAFDFLLNAGRITDVYDTKSMSILGERVRKTGRLEWISVGANRLRDLHFDRGSAPRGLLGLEYWLRYVVTFDFPNNCLYLKPSKRFGEPSLQDKSGLQIIRRVGRTVVKSVRKGSVAERAGLQPLDNIEKIGSVDAEKERLYRLRLLLSAKNTKVELTVRRKDQELHFNLDLGDRP
jgi:hypothetical protein